MTNRLFLVYCLLAPLAYRPTEGFLAPRTIASSPRFLQIAGKNPITPSTVFLSTSTTTTTLVLVNPTAAAATRTTGRKRLAVAMAFLAGWADLVFFTQFGTYATMLTGNTIKLAVSVAEGRWRDGAYLASVLGSYVLGVAIFRRTDLSLRKRTLPVCAGLVAALFVAGDCLHFVAAAGRWIPMMLFATAHGIANSLGSEVAGAVTYVVTGHFTKLSNQLVDRVSRTAGRRPLTEPQKNAVRLSSWIVAGFVAGVLFASTLSRFGLLRRFGVLSFIGLSHALLWCIHDMEGLGGAWWLRNDGQLCDLDDDGRQCQEDSDETNDAVAGNNYYAKDDSKSDSLP